MQHGAMVSTKGHPLLYVSSIANLNGINNGVLNYHRLSQYSQYVPHDTAKLIELQGGDDAFIKRLDFIFGNGYFESTNEPSQQMPFMYHYANRPGLSTQRSRQVLAEFFNTTRHGLPGNDGAPFGLD